MPVDEFAEHFSIEIDPDRDFETVAGLVLEQTGHLPALGEQVAFESMTIEVVDLDGRRIDKLLVSRRG